MNSKFLGQVYEGYEVVNGYVKEKYHKSYNDQPIKDHRAYDFTLVNYDDKKAITISGNTMRKVANGDRTVAEMLNSDTPCGSNARINAYKKGILK